MREGSYKVTEAFYLGILHVYSQYQRPDKMLYPPEPPNRILLVSLTEGSFATDQIFPKTVSMLII